ncbi:MAG: ATP-binding protein [Muribaculaceae bacterium]|nr:ATP-binding protein [Muribaculaceae bacterium]
MLKRKAITKIEQWQASYRDKALLLTGARQVGKTTAVREFAKRHYTHFIEINFVKHPIAQQAFDGTLDTDTIVTNLSAMGFGPFVDGETLVFFDEIQECPKARTAIKFLVEEHRYDYIESGSLLGINYKPVPSYPVGYEMELPMYPLDFEEFLWAKNIQDNVVNQLREAYENERPVSQFIHEQISNYYRQYLVVGGMPEVVQTFIETPDFGKVLEIQRSILTTYRADITNYAGRRQANVKRVFDAVPSELGKEDKRFVLANIETGATSRKYEDPTQWLVDAGIVYYSINTREFSLPFTAVENRRLYKLYMVDTGLLSNALLKGIQFNVLNGEIDINAGALTENFVACALIANGHSLHYFDRKSRQELDFIINEDNRISIIEVKSGTDYKRHASLDAARENYADRIARSIVLCRGNVEKDSVKNVLYLPLYMAIFI